MTAVVDMAGKRYFKWTILRRDGRNSRKCVTWTARCACGRVVRHIDGAHIRWGRRKQCRKCVAKERRERFVTHGMTGTTEYRIYKLIIQRCTNPRNPQWGDYGGRGIHICEKWRRSFSAFLADVGRRPSLKYSLDRRDNDGNYEPGNVRWATRAQQARNSVRRDEVLRDILCASAVGEGASGNIVCESVSDVMKRVGHQVEGAMVVLNFGNGDVRVGYFVQSTVERKDRCILQMFDAPFEFEEWIRAQHVGHLEVEKLVAVADK